MWTPGAFFLAQMTHLLGGALIVLAAARLGAEPLVASLLVLAWAAPKEFLFDPLVEGATLMDGAVDFSFYLVGGCIGVLFLAMT